MTDIIAVAHKLAQRQLDDIIGILRVQSAALDYEYLSHWADALGLKDLLDKVLTDAGISR